MIISASYKTDIPAFYGQWLVNRLRAGYCKVFNGYSGNVRQIDLTPDLVDGIVLWTKNIAPFLSHLEIVTDMGFPFVVQYTINGYPRILEHSVVDAQRSVKHMKRLAKTYSSSAVVWRYDPIVFSSATTFDFHLKNFEKLAKSLEGTTDEVVISFAQLYRKTLNNMDSATKDADFTWSDPADETKMELAHLLAEIASSYGMQLTMCAQRKYISPGISEAHCISSTRLASVSGRSVTARTKGNRPECRCSEAVDIGEYDTCPHGCVYCYAVRNRQVAQQRFLNHDPNGEFLFAPESGGLKSNRSNDASSIQLTLL